jgi:ribonuclease HI
MDNVVTGIVLHTDGGAKPNPGKVGWGAHGYLYTSQLDKTGNGLTSHILTKNGYIVNNARNKESEVPVKAIEYYDFFGSSETEGTNNVAEISAVCNSLEQIKDKEVNCITIFTDSDYVKRGLNEWVENWKKQDWKRKDGNDVASRIHWERLLRVIEYIKARGVSISINWVKGHADNFGNIIADRLASLGVMYSIAYVHRNEFKVTEAKGYWKNEVEKNPLLGLKRLYFNPYTDRVDGTNSYYLADPSEDHLFGRRLSESVYSIVRLLEKEEVIENVKRKQYQVSGEINSVVMLRLDRLYSPIIHDTVMEHAQYSLVPNHNKGSLGLDFLDRREITKELYPTGLPLRAIENYSHLEEILDCYNEFIEGKTITNRYFSSKGINFINITNNFFDDITEVKRGKEVNYKLLKKNIGVGTKGITISVPFNDKQLEIELLLGLDVIERNSLKRIEDKDPKIFIVTWGDEEKANYCTIISTSIGYGVWYNYYSSQIFIKAVKVK